MTRLYEVLIRYHANGNIGAHAKDIAEIESGGKIVAAHELPPRAVAASELADLFAPDRAEIIAALSAAQAAATAAEEKQRTAETALREMTLERDRCLKTIDSLSSAWRAVSDELAALKGDAQ